MSQPPLNELADRVAHLEQRIAALDGRSHASAPAHREAADCEKIPWHLLAAVVAAMLPGSFRIDSVRIVAAAHTESRWGLEGRREHFYSHRIR